MSKIQNRGQRRETAKRAMKGVQTTQDSNTISKADQLGRPRVLEFAIIRMGVPLGVAASGVGLMSTSYFLVGVVLLYICLAVFAVDVAYEGFFCKWRLPIRILLGISYVVAIIAASRAWIIFPSPLSIEAASVVPTYGPGSKMYGIEWGPRFSELYFTVTNRSSSDYDNFDAEISTDLAIKTMKQLNGWSDCKIAGSSHPVQSHSQISVGGKPLGPVDNLILSKLGFFVVFYDKDGRMVFDQGDGADWSYRILCGKIPAHSTIDFFAALENPFHENARRQGVDGAFDWPRAASWISTMATFQMSGQRRTVRIVKCPIALICQEDGRRTPIASH